MFRRFIRVCVDGSVVATQLSRVAPGDEWIEIPKGQQHMLGLDPHRLRYEPETGLAEKPRIRLSVGAFSWPADGETPVAIGVRGEALSDTQEVNVLVNGTPYAITRTDDVMLTSARPGNYTVRVADPYFYAVPGEITLTATEVDDAES